VTPAFTSQLCSRIESPHGVQIVMKRLKSKKLETTLNSLDNNDLQASQKWIAGQQ